MLLELRGPALSGGMNRSKGDIDDEKITINSDRSLIEGNEVENN